MIVGQYALTWERNDYGKQIRHDYEKHLMFEYRKNMRQPKIREGQICGTISTVLYDNHILEVNHK